MFACSSARAALASCGIAFALSGAAAAEPVIRLAPGEGLFATRADPEVVRYELVAPTIAVWDRVGGFTLTELRIEVWSASRPQIVRHVALERVLSDTGRLADLPVPALVDAQVLATGGPSAWLGGLATFSKDASLDAGEVLVTRNHPFVADFTPEMLRIVAVGRTADGRVTEVREEIPVRIERPQRAYGFPLKGAWLVSPWSSLSSHHRSLPATEFAFDAFAVRDGRIRDGDDADPGSYFGYGAEVMAAADGEVVAVISDVRSDRANRLALRAADPDAFFGDYVAGLQKDALRAAYGNVVILRHQTSEGSEFTTYGHLMEGSVRVRVGDRVRRGQVIAAVGDSGELIEPHLHFQVNAGPDPLRSRSLPVVFDDIATAPGPPGDLGRLVETRTPAG